MIESARKIFGLEDISDELMSPVVPSRRRVVILPCLVVDRDTHLWFVSVVQTVSTSVVFVAPVVLWVRHIRIVIEAIVILSRLVVAPSLTERFIALRLSRLRLSDGDNRKH